MTKPYFRKPSTMMRSQGLSESIGDIKASVFALLHSHYTKKASVLNRSGIIRKFLCFFGMGFNHESFMQNVKMS